MLFRSEMNAGYWLLRAINKITASARLTLSAVSSEKAYTDALADFPTRDALAQGIDFAHDFMTGDTRERDAWQDTVNRS